MHAYIIIVFLIIIISIHAYDKRCISLRSLYIKILFPTTDWLEMVQWWSKVPSTYMMYPKYGTYLCDGVPVFSSIRLDPVGKEEEVKEGKR